MIVMENTLSGLDGNEWYWVPLLLSSMDIQFNSQLASWGACKTIELASYILEQFTLAKLPKLLYETSYLSATYIATFHGTS